MSYRKNMPILTIFYSKTSLDEKISIMLIKCNKWNDIMNFSYSIKNE